MAVNLSPEGRLYGDTPGGNKAWILADTVIGSKEELVGNPPAVATWCYTSQGVAILFDGAQALTINNLTKSLTVRVV